jgi:selenocysteine lyase/cysteine desulfurase
VVAPGWGDGVAPAVTGARKFESLGQRDDAALAALGTAQDFHRTIGAERIERRIEQLSAALKAGVSDLGVKLVTPLNRRLCAGVCIIDVPKNRSQVFNKLYEDYGIAGAPTGGLRLCPHIYNTMDHVERAVRGIKALRPLIVT